MKKIDTHQKAREALTQWQAKLNDENIAKDGLLQHSVRFVLGQSYLDFEQQFNNLGQQVVQELEAKVAENDFRLNLPKLAAYDGVGNFINEIEHHPFYADVGDGIYGSGLMQKVAKTGQLTQSLLLFYLTSHLGEAGHNCPVACTAGVIRVFKQVGDFEHKQAILQRLVTPSFRDNFTGAQFVTEVQGGSDVGMNSCRAVQQSDGTWLISGEKWFCSNANADIILMTARYDAIEGTKGLGLFMVKRLNEDGTPNGIKIRRLKEKIGTKAMASAEIDFDNAQAIAMGKPENGFKLLMQNVLHLSRIYNSFAVLGASSRAYQVARSYAKYRTAFSLAIENYPLIQESLADIKAFNCAMLASCLATVKMQDETDCQTSSDEKRQLLLRIRANINKYMTAKKCVKHIHQCIDVLAGNGAIETFSPLPRLYRDAIVYENWEGTHNTLRMQILRDMHKYHIDRIFTSHLQQKLRQLQNDAPDKYQNWIKILQDNLTQLALKADDLLQSSSAQQTLLVRDYIDEIAIVDCCVHLLAEAVNHFVEDNSLSKTDLLAWLLLRTKMLKKNQYDEQYMLLMSKVIQEND